MKSAQIFSVLGLLALGASGCGEKKHSTRPEVIVAQDSPREVLESLQSCYLFYDLSGYSVLLADDFKFYLDPGRVLQISGEPTWDRAAETAGTSRLLDDIAVQDIRISLHFGDPVPVNELGRENWVSISVFDVFVEADLKPSPGEFEGLTLRVWGDPQVFYFRKGKNPEDTDPASPTSGKYYIVEWRDLGRSHAPSPTPVEDVTWSTLKTLDR